MKRLYSEDIRGIYKRLRALNEVVFARLGSIYPSAHTLTTAK
jgi:hypothetical protein